LAVGDPDRFEQAGPEIEQNWSFVDGNG
jgi:hypothetical protein